MDNEIRQAVYLRDRSTLTAPQRRRVMKNERRARAEIPRSMRRHANRDVVKADRQRRWSIRQMFAMGRRG